MDSHYDQVMKKREAAGQGVRRYFAYSTILDRTAFLEWRGQHGYDFFELPEGKLAEAKDLALVFDFPSRFWGGRVAGLKDQPGASVHGRLFEVPDKDWAIIQHKEGAVTGMCVEKTVSVSVGGEVVEATAFFTNPTRASGDGPVSAGFVEALTRGARSAGLPEAWLQKIGEAAR
ncbi:MAG: gamma-glutamylcyclotransferase [Myxococcaceae bacterium]|nr:gamma-glutamylcyclotransferase [Myxococcaceae bacterium]